MYKLSLSRKTLYISNFTGGIDMPEEELKAEVESKDTFEITKEVIDECLSEVIE